MAKDEYGRKKDEEFTKLSIGLRRDMDENLRKERSNIRKALDAANAQVNPSLPLWNDLWNPHKQAIQLFHRDNLETCQTMIWFLLLGKSWVYERSKCPIFLYMN